MHSGNNKISILKEINFIWFGSAVNEITRQNILDAKNNNPGYEVKLYIDSSIISADELKAMQDYCKQENISLVDIYKNEEMEKWFLYDLLMKINHQGHMLNAKKYYANASDLLRIMIMVYKGGYYFDCDSQFLSKLDKTSSPPPFGFWQQRDEMDYDSLDPKIVFPYCFQASIPFHTVYILALADIKRIYDTYGKYVLNDQDQQSNPLLLNNLGGFKDIQSRVVITLTGYAIYRAMKTWLSQLNKDWNYYSNLEDKTVIFPESYLISHSGDKSYVEPWQKECENDIRMKIYNQLQDEISKATEGDNTYWLSFFNELNHLLSHDELKDIFMQQAVINGNLDFIKNYCDDGKDKVKLQKIMNLGAKEDDNKKINNDGKTALLIAAKNAHTEIVKFIIEKAREDLACQQLLAKQLLLKDGEGKNVLQNAANTPNNEQIITLICQTAAELQKVEGLKVDLNNYINLKDDYFGSTPLHFSVRRGNFTNYCVLVKENADIKATANNGMTPINTVGYALPAEAKSFMQQYVYTEEGKKEFRTRHGVSPADLSLTAEKNPQLLETLISIDIDIGLKGNSRAQVSAYIKTRELFYSQLPKNDEDFRAIISNFGSINFSEINPADLKDAGNGADTLEKILEIASVIKEAEPKNMFVKAELLRQIKGFRETNEEAFHSYAFGKLLHAYPELSLNGIKKLEIDSFNIALMARRIVVACSYMKLNDIETHPTDGTVARLFSKFNSDTFSDDKFIMKEINQLLENLKTSSTLPEIQTLVAGISSDKRLALFKESLQAELRVFGLLPEATAKVNLAR